MKMHRIPLAIVAALHLAPGAGAAQSATAESATRVWFTGSSNVRGFTCRATSVGASRDLPSTAGESHAADSAGERVALRIPVVGLDCGIGLMNRHLRHALHADRHPDIQFTLAEYELVPGDSGWIVRMRGDLAIAGVQRPVTVDGAVAEDSAGITHVQGTHALRVTDYGVRPPRRFGGLLRVRDQVTVHFDVALPRPTGASAAQGRLRPE